jgi:hypothetical protein
MSNFNKLILHPNFHKTIRELSNNDIFLPHYGLEQNFEGMGSLTDSGKISNLEEIRGYKLDVLSGCAEASKFPFSSYDESWIKYAALEGLAYFTAHSLVVNGDNEYVPVALITFNFYTRSKAIIEKSSYIKYAADPTVEYTRDYIKDKVNFLLEFAPSHSLLFIDGPLISGDLYTIMVDATDKFLQKDIIPIHFVKNSNSNIVTSNIDSLSGQYHSDMHWLNTLLRPGERSCFFKYEDQINKKNTKIFCYIKAFDSSPQRIEFYTSTYLTYIDSVSQIMDLILYLLFVQGSKTNPQLRTIAIAEAYARSVLRSIDINKYFKEAKISPTLNQVRFGG